MKKKLIIVATSLLLNNLVASSWDNSTKRCVYNCIENLTKNVSSFNKMNINSCMNNCEYKNGRSYSSYDSNDQYSGGYYSSYDNNDYHVTKKTIKNQKRLFVSIKSGYVITKNKKQYLNQRLYIAKKGVKMKYFLTTDSGYKKTLFLYLGKNNALKVWLKGNKDKSFLFRNNEKWFRGEIGKIDSLEYNGKKRIFDLTFELKY